MDVVFTPTARAQLLTAIAYIHSQSPEAARRFRARVEASLSKLEDFPHSGRSLPAFPDLPYREVLAAPYRIYYRVEGERVWVVALWHLARLPCPPSEEVDWGPPRGREVW